MAVSAYVFIETAQAKAKDVNRFAKKIEGVKACHAVTGPYDVVAFVEAPDISVLGEFVVAKIQNIPGVIRTLTNVVAE
ncbi:MAG: Lrp/AsnC ligand binding domain-containing protein [Chlamydiae bacterium]|nr:Lrp/AsnC ligand binding domain-containing protein [Chlamydiota bacterium]MBI3266612.1 Lrp/AsnC ligand binding domain-containing protein [Chlamydiota bacterium]